MEPTYGRQAKREPGKSTAPARTSQRAPAKRAAAGSGAHRGRPRKTAVATAAAVAATTVASAPSEGTPEEPISRETDGASDRDDAEEAELYSGQYELSQADLCAQTSTRLAEPLHAVRYVLAQAKEGSTVPFLARYRQGETGRMDETRLRQVLETAKEVREVHRRRQFMLRSLESRGLLTPALCRALESMAHVSQLEDAWEPYKERRQSLATRGRAEGLGPYAAALLHFNPQVADAEQQRKLLTELRAAVNRVKDGERLLTAIVAEDVQRSEALRRRLEEYCRRTTRLSCEMVARPRKKAAKELREENFEHLKKHFAFYDGKSWSVDRIAAHVVLALQRGEAKGVLKVDTTSGAKSHGLFMHTAREVYPDIAQLLPRSDVAKQSASAASSLCPHAFRDFGYCRTILQTGLQAAYGHLLKLIHASIRRDLKKSAEQEAIVVFAHNLHHMLLQRPLSHSRILAMDPGHTHGVKCVVLDEHGGVETFFLCTLMDEEKMRLCVVQAVETRRINKVVIGNGTASAETAALVADLIKKRAWKEVEFAVVSEAGASVYSVSDIATEEFPTLDVMYRGAVSIGRRVLDPLSELVKIPVRSMGIGMYQHDVNEKELMRELGYVLESCVAKVGINAASANRYVMERVPGIQKKIVDQIVLARHAKKLHSREDLRRVPAMTESVYEQIAGFFRFPNSPEPLDSTNIHPESYALVRRLVQLYVAGQLGPAPPAGEATGTETTTKSSASAVLADASARQAIARILQQLSPLQLSKLAAQTLHCTVETLELVQQELCHPGLDPRASLPHAGLLRREVHSVKDLRPGQLLSGVVQSVTMFGAFVDCGLHDSVLVRGAGVDTLQVGAYLDKRVRFDNVDQLNRPRMFLMPDPVAAGGHGAGNANGGPRRLRLESEDVLDSATPGLVANAAEIANEVPAAVVTPSSEAATSLSAHIMRERERRRAKVGEDAAVTVVTPPNPANMATPPKSPPLQDNAAERRGQKRARSPSFSSSNREPPLKDTPIVTQALPQARMQPPRQSTKVIAAGQTRHASQQRTIERVDVTAVVPPAVGGGRGVPAVEPLFPSADDEVSVRSTSDASSGNDLVFTF